ncbi:hypothetical protein F5B22DRAFT_625031 [Xylaria bambusicola]|uniref:uncharacterized protein n=1 Tax=Xylaria bambusicola TaxID=326684 RepID=UPI0020075081|nr:uncharacterized protein F5B22DRAFT_625031 [Xylaria bambusicola]KAI0506180.1 hypothetical protein F5B22DRAFT_625031 [Xylaria bambusicola]
MSHISPENRCLPKILLLCVACAVNITSSQYFSRLGLHFLLPQYDKHPCSTALDNRDTGIISRPLHVCEEGRRGVKSDEVRGEREVGGEERGRY